MIDINNMLECYYENDDFKRYVDAHIKDSGKDIDTTMKQLVVQQYYQYINKIGDYDETRSQRI